MKQVVKVFFKVQFNACTKYEFIHLIDICLLIRFFTDIEIKNLIATERADLGYGYLYNDNNEAIVYSCWYLFVKLAINVPIMAGGFGGSLLTIALPFEYTVSS